MARGMKFLEGADIRYMIRKWQDNLSYETQGLVCFNCGQWNWEKNYGVIEVCVHCGNPAGLHRISELLEELTKRKEIQDAAKALAVSAKPADWKTGEFAAQRDWMWYAQRLRFPD